MAVFAIDPKILAASEPLASLRLCEARLQDDGRWPWIVLVPRKAGAREIEHLAASVRAELMEEIAAASAAVRAVGAAFGRPVEKVNIGALGNIVPQLHVHVIGRRADDPAWPGPAWGAGVPIPYTPERQVLAREAALPALESVRRK